MVREVDPNEQLDEEVEELLLQIADDFIESTVNASCQLAKHRQATALDVTDVQMHLGMVFYTIKLHSIMETFESLQNDSGICGFPDLEQMSCDHTRGHQ